MWKKAIIILLAYYAMCLYATTMCHADQRMIVRDPIEFATAIAKAYHEFQASIQNNFTDSECEDQENLLRHRIEYILLYYEIELIEHDAEAKQAIEESFYELMALELELQRKEEEEEALSLETLLKEGLEFPR